MRKGFTLVELIFVIVIIGILAAAAIPQFQNLKQNAEANNLVKTTVDGATAAVNASLSLMDLEDNNSGAGYQLNDILQISGKGWTYTNNTVNLGTYQYTDPANSTLVAEIIHNSSTRTVSYGIECDNFSDSTTVTKCKKSWPDGNTPAGNLTQKIVLSF